MLLLCLATLLPFVTPQVQPGEVHLPNKRVRLMARIIFIYIAANRPRWIKSLPSLHCCDFPPNDDCQGRAWCVPIVLTHQHAPVSWNDSGSTWRGAEAESQPLPVPYSPRKRSASLSWSISTGRPQGWGLRCANNPVLRQK